MRSTYAKVFVRDQTAKIGAFGRGVEKKSVPLACAVHLGVDHVSRAWPGVFAYVYEYAHTAAEYGHSVGMRSVDHLLPEPGNSSSLHPTKLSYTFMRLKSSTQGRVFWNRVKGNAHMYLDRRIGHSAAAPQPQVHVRDATLSRCISPQLGLLFKVRVAVGNVCKMQHKLLVEQELPTQNTRDGIRGLQPHECVCT